MRDDVKDKIFETIMSILKLEKVAVIDEWIEAFN